LPGIHSWHSKWPFPIYHFTWSPCGLPNLMCGNHVRKALIHSSHLAHTDVKDMDEL
jgi:hypothetical protein